MLPEILALVSKLPIQEITDEIIIEPNRVYVKPEYKMVKASNGTVLLTAREKNKWRLPIDVFFYPWRKRICPWQ